jgi:hypothetical protein
MAINNMLLNSNAISNLQTRSIVINGYSFNVSSNSGGDNSNSTSSYPSITNTALIIGLVVGLVGGSIILLGIYLGYRKYSNQNKHRPLIDDSNEDNKVDNPAVQNDDDVISSSPGGTNFIVPLATGTTTNGLKPIQCMSASTATEIERVPSAAVSITMLDFMQPNNGQRPTSSLPHVELIKFD